MIASFLPLLFLLLQAVPLLAQHPTQTIRGRVIDRDTKTPIAYATVVLLHTSPPTGSITDAEGYFRLPDVPVGRYTIEVSFVGYEPLIINEIVVSSAKETILSLPLKESVATLQEVVVRPRIAKEAPLHSGASVSARMLSVEEARRYAGGFDDPARLASAFAGVASNVANNGIVIRGNAPKSLQWKMEGVEIPNPNHFADLSAFGGGGLTALSSQMLANSDFFTGAFPAEYSNAISGVFDIQMRTGNNEKQEHTLQAGIIGMDVASEGPFQKGSKASYLFNYRYSTLSLVAPLLPEEAQGTTYQDLAFKLNFPSKKRGVFSLWGLGLTDRSGQEAESRSELWQYMQDREQEVAKQFMGAAGLGHHYFFNQRASLKTSLAATLSGLDWHVKRMNGHAELVPQRQIESRNWNFVLTSSLQQKFSARHTNQTGLTLTGLQYDLLLRDAANTEGTLATLVEEQGFSSLLSAYTSSSLQLGKAVRMNVGLTGQLFTLNGQYSLEPRMGLTWQLQERQQLGLAYGLHSRLERLQYYFMRAPLQRNELLNKDMDFTKAHHLVMRYGRALSENLHLVVEPYYQQLFRVPTLAGSSFSFINLQNEWFFNQALQNTGKGRNYGLDITLEKHLSKGYFFLVTASLFQSEYAGGDGIWRNSRYNRNFLLNLLAGQEWQLGTNGQRLLGISARLTFQGGDRYTPVDEYTSLQQQQVVYNERLAFSKQMPPSLQAHLTASYTINRAKTAHEISLKILNATGYSDFFGFRYNYLSHSIDEHRETILIPNLSYKIEF
jgi:hypothetical protein